MAGLTESSGIICGGGDTRSASALNWMDGGLRLPLLCPAAGAALLPWLLEEAPVPLDLLLIGPTARAPLGTARDDDVAVVLTPAGRLAEELRRSLARLETAASLGPAEPSWKLPLVGRVLLSEAERKPNCGGC